MYIDYAFLAEKATQNGGVFNVVGGNVDQIIGPIPAPSLPMSLVVRFRDSVEAAPGRTHEFQIYFVPPGGQRKLLMRQTFVLSRKTARDEPLGTLIVADVRIPMKQQGKHVFEIEVDKQVLKCIRLYLERPATYQWDAHLAGIPSG